MIGIDQVESPSGGLLDRWQLQAVEYTAVFSDGLEPEPSRVRTIREFDPDYVPLLVRRTFKSPTGGVEIFGYHVIGRHIPVMPQGDTRNPVHLASVPSVGWKYATGTIYAQRTWSTPWKKGSVQFRNGYPDIYRPHDDWLVRWMRAMHSQMFLQAQSIQASMMAAWRKEVEEEDARLEAVQKDRLACLKNDHSEFRDAVANELHWLEHPDQRPAAPSPKGFTEVHKEAP